MVGVSKLDFDMAKRESPTTDKFFRIDEITDRGSEEYNDFREDLTSLAGIRNQ